MLKSPHFVSGDRAVLRTLVDDYPFATIVSNTSRGLVASHYPVMWESRDDEVTLVTHFGRPDEETHELVAGPVLVIVQGPHAYISPKWYPAGQFVPTWNHVTAHLQCDPELLDADENFAVLERLVDKFEGAGGTALRDHDAAARSIATGTVGVRLRVRSVEMLEKLSQNKPAPVVASVIDALAKRPNDLNQQLVDAMRSANADRLGG